MVRRLTAGGDWIRTLGSAPKQALCRARDERPGREDPLRQRLEHPAVRMIEAAVEVARSPFLTATGRLEAGCRQSVDRTHIAFLDRLNGCARELDASNICKKTAGHSPATLRLEWRRATYHSAIVSIRY